LPPSIVTLEFHLLLTEDVSESPGFESSFWNDFAAFDAGQAIEITRRFFGVPKHPCHAVLSTLHLDLAGPIGFVGDAFQIRFIQIDDHTFTSHLRAVGWKGMPSSVQCAN